MKKLSLFFAAMFMAASCAEPTIDNASMDGTTDDVQLTVIANSDATATTDSRVAVDEDLKLSWKVGDELAGWSQDNSKVTKFAQVDGATSEFKGQVTGDVFRLVHPYASVGDGSINGNIYTIDISNQTGDLSDMPMINAKLLSKANVEATSMKHIGAVAKVVLDISNAPADNYLTSVSLLLKPISIEIDLTKGVTEDGFYGEKKYGPLTITPAEPIAVKNGEMSPILAKILPFAVAPGAKIDIVATFKDADGESYTKELASVNNGTESVSFNRGTIGEIYCKCDLADSGAADLPETTTTIADLRKMTATTTGTVINQNKAIVFEGIVTSSTLSSNTLNAMIMLQQPGSTTVNHGIVMNACSLTNMKKVVANIAETDGEAFGVKILVSIPSVEDGGEPISIIKNYTQELIFLKNATTGADNTKYITAIEKVTDFQPINVTNDIANLTQYQSMYVKVDNATLETANGVWGSTAGGTMTYVGFKTEAAKAFNIFIKGACTDETYGFTGKNFYKGTKGDVTGSVVVHIHGTGIAPRIYADVAPFCVEPTTGGDQGDSGDASVTTISEMIAKCKANGDAPTQINPNGEVSFEAVITSSSTGLNLIHQYVAMQDVDADNNLVTTPNSGLFMTKAAAANLIKMAKKNGIVADGETFGLKVKVTFPADVEAKISLPTTPYKEVYYSLTTVEGTDNTPYMEPIEVIGMKPLDITNKLADLADYQAMYVTVPNVTIESNGTWNSDTDMHFIAATAPDAAATKDFDLFFKKKLPYWDFNYTAGTGSITGIAASYHTQCGISPCIADHVIDFGAKPAK